MGAIFFGPGDHMTKNKIRIELRLLRAIRPWWSTRVDAVASITAKGSFSVLLAAVLAPCAATAAEDVAQLSMLSRLAATPASSVPLVAAAAAAIETPAAAAHRPHWADFQREHATHEARYLADWVVDSGDNQRMPFAIVDKTDAKVFMFDPNGRLRGAAPALLGLAIGDDTVPGIGDRVLSRIRPEERTTPAGRFVASLDRNLRGKEILWVDYDSAVSMHPVIRGKPAERRAERLATPTPLDNRISYGCINVPARFFEDVVRPAFAGTNGIVYVLPETRPARQVFASYYVVEHTPARASSPTAPAQSAAPAARR